MTHLSPIHDEDFITVPDGVDAVCNGQHGVVTATLTDGLLNQEVCARVYRGCCFVQHQDLKKTSGCTMLLRFFFTTNTSDVLLTPRPVNNPPPT